MSTRSGIETVGEAGVVSAVLSAGLLALLAQSGIRDLLSTLGDGVVVGWVVMLGVGSLALGVRRRLPTGDLLGGGLGGMIMGWLGFSVVVGFDFVLLVIALLGGVGWVVGTWGTYEWRRRNGTPTEPPLGTWRLLFSTVVAVLIVVVLLAVAR